MIFISNYFHISMYFNLLQYFNESRVKNLPNYCNGILSLNNITYVLR